MAKRVQRKRTKGYRLPAGAVCVHRPTKWGNPTKVSTDGRHWFVTVDGLVQFVKLTKLEAKQSAVRLYRAYLQHGGKHLAEQAAAELRGKDLACFCGLDEPCHADVLLEIANAKPTVRRKAAKPIQVAELRQRRKFDFED